MTKYQKSKLILLTSFSILFLLMLFNYSLNGRYIFAKESSAILDTKTGTIYVPSKRKFLELDEYSK